MNDASDMDAETASHYETLKKVINRYDWMSHIQSLHNRQYTRLSVQRVAAAAGHTQTTISHET